jgi:predicted PurR-regulated permease PerM
MTGPLPPPKVMKGWTTQQVVLATLFVVVVFLILWMLFRLRQVIFLLLISIVVGTAIRPAVEWLHRRGVPGQAAVILIYVVIGLLLVSLLAVALPLLADQATQLSQDLPHYYDAARQALVNSNNRLLHNLGLRAPANLTVTINRGATAEQALDRAALTIYFANAVVRGILGTLATFLLAYYWTQERRPILRTLLRLLPQSRRKSTRDFLQMAEGKISGFVQGEGLLALVVGSAAFIAYALIGLPFALVLGIIAGLMELVPIFGPALGAIPASLVALSVDPQKILWVVLATALIQTTENAFLVPRIMKRSMGVNPILILLSMLAFASVFGFLGALLALPLAAVLQLLIDRAVLSAQGGSGLQYKEVDIQTLVDEGQELLQIIQTAGHDTSSPFYQMPEPDRAEIRAIARDLGSLLAQLQEEDEAL